MKYVHLLLLITSLSCTQSAETAPAELPVEFENEPGVVQLNNGQKWTANPETKEGIARMKTIVAQNRVIYEPNDPLLYSNTASAMLVTIKEIFSKCDMEGAAHEELHDYLVPLMGNRKRLESKDLE